jgi:hypothetical protein
LGGVDGAATSVDKAAEAAACTALGGDATEAASAASVGWDAAGCVAAGRMGGGGVGTVGTITRAVPPADMLILPKPLEPLEP